MIAILSLFGCGNVEDEQTVTVENPTVIVIQEENKEAVADIDKTQQQNASETSKEEPIEVETESQLEEETEDQSEAETEEAMKKNPEILHFVDVFGEEYEVEINENVAKTPYDNLCFKRDGDHLNYDDDKGSVLDDLKAKKEEVARTPKKEAIDKGAKTKGGEAI